MGLVQDYVSGRYREVPWRVIATAAFAVLYFLNPFDLIPDFIPGIGFIDDATLISMAVAALREELRRYETPPRRQSLPEGMVNRPGSPGSTRSRD